MDLKKHADISGDIRRAADMALGMGAALNEINRGPVFDHERDKNVDKIDAWFCAIGKALGYSVVKYQDAA
ncbi:hypothetical protein LB521_27585 [Mesorhizobium sp. BR-1-1-8]|uniref:hypothetical protein n=1 Tax=Mesorhizobium sp. BR-1-1-8 TaxID=2876659 RepID=UPI001CC9BCDB|nr:hypothetical protein [Mesorhizobium sp. BR-1-1-8]MBZ9984899.1 hypothetical protein [Mesorhizobium sp. BR-1-1-8]